MSWNYKVPPNNLISGLSFKFYNYDYMENILHTVNNDKWLDKREIKSAVRIPVSLLIDIDTIYLSNPLDPKQIYKPIEPIFTETGLNNPTNNISNDIMDFKFKPGYFLSSIILYKDAKIGKNGGIYGIYAVVMNYFKRNIEYVKIGYAQYFAKIMSYETLPVTVIDRAPVYIGYKQLGDFNKGEYFVTTLSGIQNTKTINQDLMPSTTGNFMDINVSFGNPELVLEVNYPGDDIYQCCFGYNKDKCNSKIDNIDVYIMPEDPICVIAKTNWCKLHPTDYACRKEKFTNYVPKINECEINKKMDINKIWMLILIIIVVIILGCDIIEIPSFNNIFKSNKKINYEK